MPRIPHDPDRARLLEACMLELRRRHNRNPRRMYARRVEHFAGMDIPLVPNPNWYYAVALRYVRMGGKETT